MRACVLTCACAPVHVCLHVHVLTRARMPMCTHVRVHVHTCACTLMVTNYNCPTGELWQNQNHTRVAVPAHVEPLVVVTPGGSPAPGLAQPSRSGGVKDHVITTLINFSRTDRQRLALCRGKLSSNSILWEATERTMNRNIWKYIKIYVHTLDISTMHYAYWEYASKYFKHR